MRPMCVSVVAAAWLGLIGCGPDKGGETTGSDGSTTGGSMAMTGSTAPTSGPAPTGGTTDIEASSGTTAPSSGAVDRETTETTAETDADGCFADVECAAGECVGAGEVCEVCNDAAPTCVDDFVCAPGDVCIEIRVACPCDAEFTTICAPACATSDDCGNDATCDVESGHCIVHPCAVDEDCPPLFACADAVGGDACRRRSCASDADCDGAVCVDGGCHDAPGVCVAAPF